MLRGKLHLPFSTARTHVAYADRRRWCSCLLALNLLPLAGFAVRFFLVLNLVGSACLIWHEGQIRKKEFY
jgi:hypothetical protein